MTDVIYPFDDEETDESAEEPKQNNQLAAAQRKLAKLEKEAEELRQFRAEREQQDRQNTVKQVFSEVGLQPEWAEFYQSEDATPEAVKQWAVTKKFLTQAEPEETAPPVAPATGFTPTVVADASPVGSKMYEADEFAALLARDPVKAEQVYKAGRLKKEVPEWGLATRYHGRD